MMLVAMGAFVQQGTMIAVSQAMASGGFMPQPATMLSGPVHFHDNLAVNMHAHDGDKGAGHAHGPADLDHDESDEAIKAPVCSIGHTSAVMPTVVYAVVHGVIRAAEHLPQDRLDGVEPDGLSRPPSTPSIA